MYQSDIVLKTQVEQQQLIIASLVNQNIITQTKLCKIEKYFLHFYSLQILIEQVLIEAMQLNMQDKF